MVVLAYFIPGPGLAERPIPLEKIAGYGVIAIFFFYGLRLDFHKLRIGLANRNLHLLIQLTTFLLFPLIAVAVRPLFSGATMPLWVGISYLCALPSTVSSSIVMVSIANGNVPAAIFNASISSLIGVFITPLWVNMFVHTGAADIDQWTVITQLMLQVLLPVAIGIALHNRLGKYALHHQKALRTFDQVVILVIIYCSFCKSFASGVFGLLSWSELGMLTVGMLGLFFLVVLLTGILSRSLGFSPADRITAIFCGSKKSLVQGTVMSKVLFPASATIGIILLPLMLYHALQLIAASILAQRVALPGAPPRDQPT